MKEKRLDVVGAKISSYSPVTTLLQFNKDTTYYNL